MESIIPRIRRPVVRPFDASATLSASLLGGSAFLAVVMLFTPEPAWMSVQREASLFVFAGPDALASFSFGLVCIGLLVHYAWAFALTTTIDSAIRMFRMGPALVAGAVIGVALYLFDAAVLVAWAPWFAPQQGLAMLAAHVVLAMVAAGAYEGIEDRHAALREAHGMS